MSALWAILTAFVLAIAWAWFVTRDRGVSRWSPTPEQMRRLAEANRDIAAAFPPLSIAAARATVAQQAFGESWGNVRTAVTKRPPAVPWVLRPDGSIDFEATRTAQVEGLRRINRGGSSST